MFRETITLTMTTLMQPSKIISLILCIFSTTVPHWLAGSEVAIGFNYDAVVEALGKPDGVLNAGSKQILTYGKASVKLQNGVVNWVSPELKGLLEEREAKRQAVEEKRGEGLTNFRGEWMTPEKRAELVKAENETRRKAMLKQTSSNGGEWLTDYDRALALAKSRNKQVLLNFTGSDWCGWCIKLDSEVFSQPQFINHAKDHYILVKLDFPRRSKLPAALAKQNKSLANKYKVGGFPSVVVLDASGQLYKKGGYVSGGPNAFLASIR